MIAVHIALAALAATAKTSPVTAITPAVAQTLQSSTVSLSACGRNVTAFVVSDDGMLAAPAASVVSCLHASVSEPALGPFAAHRIVMDEDGYIALYKVDPRAVAGRLPVRISTSPQIAAAPRTALLGTYGRGDLIRVVSRGGSKTVLRFGIAKGHTVDPSAPVFTQDGSLVAFARGPGSSKARFATMLAPLIAEARGIIARKAIVVLAHPLSEEADDVVTPEQRAAGRPPEQDLPLYAVGAWDVWVQMLTPAALTTLAEVKDQSYRKDGPFFLWPHHLGMSQPRVVVQRAPQATKTAASGAKQFGQVFGMVLGNIVLLGGAAYSGVSTSGIGGPVSPSKYAVSNNVDAIELTRDGVKVPSAEQRETCITEATSVTRYRSRRKADVVSCSNGCTTLVSFPPEAFAPGAEVVLHVHQSASSRVRDVPIPQATLRRITADFEPYFQARREREALASR